MKLFVLGVGLKRAIDGSNLGRFGRDQPRFDPCMSRLIVPGYLTCDLLLGAIAPPAEHNSSMGGITPSTMTVLMGESSDFLSFHPWRKERKSNHLWLALISVSINLQPVTHTTVNNWCPNTQICQQLIIYVFIDLENSLTD